MQMFVHRGVDFVMRLPLSHFSEFQNFVESKARDGIFIIQRKSDPPISVRVVHYKIGGMAYYLVTSLIDPAIPCRALRDLYHKRWGIEEFFKSLKQEAKLEAFSSKSKNGILQELHTSIIIHSLSRLAELQTMKTRLPKPKQAYNHRHSTTMLVNLLPKLICKNVLPDTLLKLSKSIELGRYHVYERRSYPRVSYKPSSRWRKTPSFSSS